MDFQFQRDLIQIGSIQIRYYGIIVVAAMLLATTFAAGLAKRTKRDPEHVYGGLTWAIIPGIILARLWFVFFPAEGSAQTTEYMLNNFFNTTDGAIAIWSGGLSIFGALLGGGIGAYLYMLKNKLIVPAWLDIAGVVIPLAQAVGRWANYVNQELYGTPTGVSWWGLTIDRDILRNTPYGALEYFDAKFHPLFLYESVWSFVAFIILYRLYRTRRNQFRPGDFFLIYVAQYSFIRFFLEFIRAEETLVGGTNVSQIVTAAAFVIAVGLFLYRRNNTDSRLPYDEAAPSELLTANAVAEVEATA